MSIDLHPAILASAPGTRRLRWRDEPACEAFARDLAARILAGPQPVDLTIELHGPLGAGKTTFVRHLLRALGVAGRIKSPTYTVLEPHEAAALPGQRVSHFDFYRFADPREWADAGLRELFAEPGLRLCEWPQQAAGVLPRPDLVLRIEPADEGGAAGADPAREVELEAVSARGRALLA